MKNIIESILESIFGTELEFRYADGTLVPNELIRS